MTINSHGVGRFLQAFALDMMDDTDKATTIPEYRALMRVADKVSRGYYPTAGVPARTIAVPGIGAVKAWIVPAFAPSLFKSSKHRVLCECPHCGTELSAGRLDQHVDTLTCHNARVTRDIAAASVASPALVLLADEVDLAPTPRRRATDNRGNPGYNVPA